MQPMNYYYIWTKDSNNQRHNWVTQAPNIYTAEKLAKERCDREGLTFVMIEHKEADEIF